MQALLGHSAPEITREFTTRDTGRTTSSVESVERLVLGPKLDPVQPPTLECQRQFIEIKK